jgi:hypothetical protein
VFIQVAAKTKEREKKPHIRRAHVVTCICVARSARPGELRSTRG